MKCEICGEVVMPYDFYDFDGTIYCKDCIKSEIARMSEANRIPVLIDILEDAVFEYLRGE